MRRMKKYDHFARLVYNFTNYECSIGYGHHFSYFPEEKMVVFTFEDDVEDCQEFKKFLAEKFNFTLTKENLFTISILHELGHHFTADLFSNEEWDYQTSEECLKEIDDCSEYAQAYFNMPIEFIATKFAVDAYRKNPKAMHAWDHRFTCAIRHLEKKEKRKLLIDF